MDVFDFISELCIGAGIAVDFDSTGKMKGDVHFKDLNISIKFRSLDDAQLTAPKVDGPITSLNSTYLVVHLWEDQWIHQNNKVKSKIRSLLGITSRIHARETTIEKIDNTMLLQFLDQNHLNVAIKGKYKYCLKYRGEIVAVISFSKGRAIKRDNELFSSYELLRFCNKLDYTVIGGFSKLLHHFIKTQRPHDIMTYVDADWSNGKSLISLGFTYEEYKEPVELWLNLTTGIREYPHIVLQKHTKLADKRVSEMKKLLKVNGYLQIFNSGSYKFLLKLK